MLRTRSSSRSADKERTIIVFDSSILRRDCIFVEEFFNFEPRRINNDLSQLSKKGTERIHTQLTTNQRNSTRTGQLDNEESRFCGTRIMPYTPVSCGTGHSFRDTRTMPYAYRGGECQSERAPAWRENAFWSCVLDSSRQRCSKYSEAEWEKEGIRVRPKAFQKTQWNQGWDEQTNQPRVWANADNWALNQISWQGENNSSVPLDNSSKRLPFCGGIRQFSATKQ